MSGVLNSGKTGTGNRGKHQRHGPRRQTPHVPSLTTWPNALAMAVQPNQRSRGSLPLPSLPPLPPTPSFSKRSARLDNEHILLQRLGIPSRDPCHADSAFGLIKSPWDSKIFAKLIVRLSEKTCELSDGPLVVRHDGFHAVLRYSFCFDLRIVHRCALISPRHSQSSATSHLVGGSSRQVTSARLCAGGGARKHVAYRPQNSWP